MRILSSIISRIWNTITFMDKEQRALVAHVLTISQAHPKSFAFRNGAWRSDGMKVTYTQAQKNVNLSGVFYELGWRANAILAKHFAMLHICLHHEHIGRALSEIDRGENGIVDSPKKKANTYDNQQTVGDVLRSEEKMVAANIGKRCDMVTPTDGFATKVVEVTPIDLTKYIGKQIIATRRNGNRTTGVVANGAEIEVGSREIRFAGLSFDRYGNHWGSGRQCGLDIMSVEEIKQPEWITDIDLAQWVGNTVDVKLRNGTIVDAVDVNHRAGKTLYQVKVEHVSYTRCGKFWHDRLDGRDIMAIRPAT